MVKYSDAPLDRTFAALSDPTRRALIARLGENSEEARGLSVSDLARPFAMSLPAVMKHLDVLADAGLVTRTKTGRTVQCRLNTQPMEDAMHWLAFYQRFWSDRLDRLAAFVEEKKPCPPSQPPSPPSSRASPSNVVSMHPRRKSTPRGRTPRRS